MMEQGLEMPFSLEPIFIQLTLYVLSVITFD